MPAASSVLLATAIILLHSVAVRAWRHPRPATLTRRPPLPRLLAEPPSLASSIVDALLTYADLRPYNVSSPTGALFLATNALYLSTGLAQMRLPETQSLGILVEIAGLMSLWYHFSQLRYGPSSRKVKVALLLDYASAWYAIISGLVIAAQTLSPYALLHIPFSCVLFSGIGIVFLFLSWVEGLNFGVPYMVLHGSWHICSGYAASLFGDFVAGRIS